MSYRAFKSLFTLRIGIALVVCLLGASFPAQAAFPTGEVASVLAWLPDDIESLTCAQGPMPVHSIRRESKPRKKSESQVEPPSRPPLSISTQFYTSNVWLPVAEKRLAGRTIRLSLEGKRKFRAPKELGMERYEGCGVLLLQPDPSVTQEQLNKELQNRSKKKLDIQGVAVSLISGAETRNNRENWEVYLAAPDTNTILIATNLAVLEHVIGQIKTRPVAVASSRALGPQWYGWPFVNTDSRLWMVRHDVSHAAENQEPNDLVGYEDVANRCLVITGMMTNKVELFKAISNIRTETSMRVITKEIHPGTYEIRCWFTADAEELGTLSFYLTGIFGPTIVVAPF